MTRPQLLGAAAVVAAALLACATPAPRVGPWTVSGASSQAYEDQALAIVDAARRLYPDSALKYERVVYLMPDIDYPCGYRWPEPPGVLHYAGCASSSIWVLWPHPKCPPDADLTCSALAHEVCHLVTGMGNNVPAQEQADACALLVVLEHRRSLP